MIRVEGVSKRFRIYVSPTDRLKEKLFGGVYHHEYSALSDISFEVGQGETFGIIGENGAGKSTLLKILAGVLIPDSGKVEVSGKITGLLELGTGFNPELSGVDNIFMNGTFLGMSHAEIVLKKDEIIEFAELGDFIHEPLKTYSSGMMVRLGFAIAIHAEPECFLVDEALSVGDAYFQQKCMRKIEEFKNRGGSIIIVSHDINAIKTLCDRTIYIERGKAVNIGNTKEVTDFYLNLVLTRMHQGEESITFVQEKNRGFSTEGVELLSIKICNDNGDEISHITRESNIQIKYEVRALRDLVDPHFGFALRNRNGLSIFQTNTSYLNLKQKPLNKGEKALIVYSMSIPLSNGIYSFSIGIGNKQTTKGSFEEYLLLMHDIKQIEVISNNDDIVDGIFNMHPNCKISYDIN